MMMKVDENDSKTPKDYQIVENPANSDEKSLERKFMIIRGAYQRKYPKLSDEIFEYLPGQFDKMMDRIASNTERCWSEVHNEIMHWKIDENRDGL